LKIVRYSKNETTFYGILKDGKITTVSGSIFSGFREIDEHSLLKDVRLLPPVDPPNIIAIGLNYKSHAIETKMDFPPAPVIFIKTTNTLAGPDDTIILPKMAPDEVDYEAELAIVIGKKAKNVKKEEAFEYVLGYTCAQDISARDCQIRLDVQWARGKSFDTFCPIGPYIETEMDPDNARISLKLNDKVMQESNTGDLIFSCADLVSYLSRCMTLYPGTLILTGTPSGVGFTRKPPVFLRNSDRTEVEIENIGVLRNSVVAE
jgi:2-keto-4-pentenoate hydratase/2-oxohepta-3-ene-1,7-dioic acid hydratase in catechol pathway